MKKNTIIMGIVIVLAIASMILVLSQSKSTFRKAQSDFAVADTSTVTKIYMSDKNNNDITLVRTDSAGWILDGTYHAHRYNVNMLLQTMHDIQVKEPVARKARNTIIKLMATDAVKVEIYQQRYRIDLLGIRLFPHEKRTKVYYVGGATPSNLGSYFLMEHSEEPFVVFLPGLKGFVTPRFSPIAKYWRDCTVFHKWSREISRVRVEIPETPEHSFEVINHDSKSYSLVSLIDNKEIPDFDTLKVIGFLSGFRNLNFEALLNDMDPHRKDSILSSRPFIVMTLTDTNGVSETIQIYHKQGFVNQTDMYGKPLPYDPDRLYARVNDGQDFTLIQYFVFGKVLRPKAFFLKQKE